MIGPDEHLGDLLAAYVDHAATAEERAAVEAHVATCSACLEELSVELRVHEMLRTMPIVTVPPGFFERLDRMGPTTRSRRSRALRFAVANLVGSAAALVLVVGFVSAAGAPSVSPNVASSVSAHVDAEQVVDDTAPTPAQLSPVGDNRALRWTSDPAGAARAAAAAGLPEVVFGSFGLAAVVQRPWAVQAVYSDGHEELSVFVQDGHLRWQSLPDDAQPVLVAGQPAWRLEAGGREVLLIERPEQVITIVGPLPAASASAVARAIPGHPGTDHSVIGRIRDAGRDLLGVFGLQG